MLSDPIRVGAQAVVIEFPRPLSDQARSHISSYLEDWSADPLRPLVLEDGARIRVLGPDGRISPADREPLYDFSDGLVLGIAIAATGFALLQAVFS